MVRTGDGDQVVRRQPGAGEAGQFDDRLQLAVESTAAASMLGRPRRSMSNPLSTVGVPCSSSETGSSQCTCLRRVWPVSAMMTPSLLGLGLVGPQFSGPGHHEAVTYATGTSRRRATARESCAIESRRSITKPAMSWLAARPKTLQGSLVVSHRASKEPLPQRRRGPQRSALPSRRPGPPTRSSGLGWPTSSTLS